MSSNTNCSNRCSSACWISLDMCFPKWSPNELSCYPASPTSDEKPSKNCDWKTAGLSKTCRLAFQICVFWCDVTLKTSNESEVSPSLRGQSESKERITRRRRHGGEDWEVIGRRVAFEESRERNENAKRQQAEGIRHNRPSPAISIMTSSMNVEQGYSWHFNSTFESIPPVWIDMKELARHLSGWRRSFDDPVVTKSLSSLVRGTLPLSHTNHPPTLPTVALEEKGRLYTFRNRYIFEEIEWRYQRIKEKEKGWPHICLLCVSCLHFTCLTCTSRVFSVVSTHPAPNHGIQTWPQSDCVGWFGSWKDMPRQPLHRE